jgi:hypothetical protein
MITSGGVDAVIADLAAAAAGGRQAGAGGAAGTGAGGGLTSAGEELGGPSVSPQPPRPQWRGNQSGGTWD